MNHILLFKNMSKFTKMLLFVDIFKIFKKSQKISSICRFLKFFKNAPIYEHFLNLIFGQKSKKKKKQYPELTKNTCSWGVPCKMRHVKYQKYQRLRGIEMNAL